MLVLVLAQVHEATTTATTTITPKAQALARAQAIKWCMRRRSGWRRMAIVAVAKGKVVGRVEMEIGMDRVEAEEARAAGEVRGLGKGRRRVKGMGRVLGIPAGTEASDPYSSSPECSS